MEDYILKYISKNKEDTILFGKKIGELVEAGQIILLSGELGVGKTTLTQGIAQSLEIKDDLTSPTFNLINEHEGRLLLFHMDLYRLEAEEDLFDLGFEEYLERNGVIVIEWPDLAYDLLPNNFIYICIEIKGNEKRQITIEPEGEQGRRLVERLRDHVNTGN